MQAFLSKTYMSNKLSAL